MFRKKLLIAVVFGLFFITGSTLVTASAMVDQIGVLSGPVIDVVTVGTTVREGDILVRVSTLTGAVPATRATTNGVVAEVLVKPGDTIKIGDVVAHIKTGK